jgi:hypothetical protein
MPHEGERGKTLQRASTGEGHIGSNIPIEHLKQRMQDYQTYGGIEHGIAAPGTRSVASRGPPVKAREDPVTHSQSTLAQPTDQYQVGMGWEQHPEHWEPACSFLQQDEATGYRANSQTQETTTQKTAAKRRHTLTPTAPDAAPCVDDKAPNRCYLEHR